MHQSRYPNPALLPIPLSSSLKSQVLFPLCTVKSCIIHHIISPLSISSLTLQTRPFLRPSEQTEICWMYKTTQSLSDVAPNRLRNTNGGLWFMQGGPFFFFFAFLFSGQLTFQSSDSSYCNIDRDVDDGIIRVFIFCWKNDDGVINVTRTWGLGIQSLVE